MLFQIVDLRGIDKTMIDGPYLQYEGDSVVITWVNIGELHRKVVPKNANYNFEEEGLPSFSLQDLSIEKDDDVDINGVKKYVALSDIHGQFDVFEHLMIVHGVSNAEQEWTYGKGHLIIVGDMLDRGDEVLKVLWYLYHLEKKAEKAGGKVHVLLGNHEIMVMNGELGYLHKKYRYTSGISRTIYSEYFGKNTFWGQWLASKNVIKAVNNTLFLHGGLSEAVLKQEADYLKYNDIFRDKILHHRFEKLGANKLVSLLTFRNGPLWYRGYAKPYEFDTKKADRILKLTGRERIVIGHTSMPRVMSLYDDRIILVDSSMKFGRSGELLIFNDGSFFRGMMNGNKEPLITESKKIDPESITEVLYDQEGPSVFINMDRIYKGVEKLNLEVIFSTYFDLYGLDFSADVDGDMIKNGRRCQEQKIAARIPTEQLINFGFAGNGLVEIILPCDKIDEKVWVPRRIGQLAKITDNKLYKPIRVLIEDMDKKVLDTKGILVLTVDNLSKGTNP